MKNFIVNFNKTKEEEEKLIEEVYVYDSILNNTFILWNYPSIRVSI